jgi:hypothetical protein
VFSRSSRTISSATAATVTVKEVEQGVAVGGLARQEGQGQADGDLHAEGSKKAQKTTKTVTVKKAKAKK